MSVTWGFGLRGIAEVGGVEHERILRSIWQLAPGNPEDGDRIRDRQTLNGVDAIFEVDPRGEFGRMGPAQEQEILRVLRSLELGDSMGWSNDLAAAFHVDVGSLGVPWLVKDPNIGSFREAWSMSNSSTWLDGREVQFVRSQASAVAIDESSELLADYGLGRNEAFALNQQALRYCDVAVDHSLLMFYG
jgi:hypothetical protein